jgi:hypothetical protein
MDAATLGLLPGVQDALATWSGYVPGVKGYNEFANAPVPEWAGAWDPNMDFTAENLNASLAASIFG